jgi:hypothetical protein
MDDRSMEVLARTEQLSALQKLDLLAYLYGLNAENYEVALSYAEDQFR